MRQRSRALLDPMRTARSAAGLLLMVAPRHTLNIGRSRHTPDTVQLPLLQAY